MKKKTSKRALIMSMISLLVCVSLLIGTTYAWFTDSVTSGGNIIKSGILDVEMRYADTVAVPEQADAWKDASSGAIFDYDLWEPGFVQVRHIDIANVGNLALEYQIRIVLNGQLDVNSAGNTLADAIDVYYADPATTPATRALEGFTNLGKLSAVLEGISDISNTASGVLYPAGTEGKLSEHKVTIALKMSEEAGNEYQNMQLGGSFSVQLLATQYTAEHDSFDNQYDAQAHSADYNFPVVTDSASATVVAGEPTVITAGLGSAIVPAGATNADAGDLLTLYIEENDKPDGLRFSAAYDDSMTYEVTIKDQDGNLIEATDEPIRVSLYVGRVNPMRFWHNGTQMVKKSNLSLVTTTSHWCFDSATGFVTFLTDSFSLFTLEYFYAGGLGTQAYPYLIRTEAQFVAMSNRNYYFELRNDLTFTETTKTDAFGLAAVSTNFRGVFDGKGHTITLDTDGALFGTFETNNNSPAEGATIKNLIVTFNAEDNAVVSFMKNATLSSITTNGQTSFSSTNRGLFVHRAYMEGNNATFTFTLENCVNNADVVFNGSSDICNAVFIGNLAIGNATSNAILTFKNCVNNGDVTGQKVALFIGNANSYNIDTRIENCKNTGVIRALNTSCYANFYYADPSNCYGVFIINGTSYANQQDRVQLVPSIEEDTLIENTGMFIQDSGDVTLALHENADHTFMITPATNPNVVKYIVTVGTPASYYNEDGTGNGSGRIYVKEEITDTTVPTTIKHLAFVDLQWVANHSSAVTSTLCGKTVYELDGVQYYLIDNPYAPGVAGYAFSETVREARMITVVGVDVNGAAICSADLA